MEVPEKYRGWLKRARTGSRPLSAIRAKCLECVCWQQSEVSRCHLTDCPLWLYRFGHRASEELLEWVRPTLESSHRRPEIFPVMQVGQDLLSGKRASVTRGRKTAQGPILEASPALSGAER